MPSVRLTIYLFIKFVLVAQVKGQKSKVLFIQGKLERRKTIHFNGNNHGQTQTHRHN